MACEGNLPQAARETARVAISTTVSGIANGVITVGAHTPVVAPLCAALLEAKGVVDGASRNKEELQELHARCEVIAVQVIDRFNRTSSKIDVAPIVACVDDIKKLVKRHGKQRCCTRIVQFRTYEQDIRKLRGRIETIVPVMGLATAMTVADELEAVRQMVARLQPRPKLAPPPPGAPVGQSWHAVRDGVVDRVCQILGDDEPGLAALTGRSGAGKSTAAAAMIGERQGLIRPLAGETEDEARTRLDRIRARFSAGVIWLRVGKGEGRDDRLPRLMLTLARALHKDVMKSHVDAPALGDDGESYVKRIVEQESLRCLVVADDVWEAEVLEKLRKTGMWVLVTTRLASIVEPNERVVVDKLEDAEAENVLRGAARLPAGQRLCDDAMKVLEICGHVAMDIAFVGNWSSVRTADNGIPKSNKAWAGAVADISHHRAILGDAGGMDDAHVNRLAVLRTGYKYLGKEDPLTMELYVALAVFPDGHPFGQTDAAVLLDDEEAAAEPISILERWGVLRPDTHRRYRMHGVHVGFARGKLIDRADIRNPAIRRWSSRISRLDFATSIDVYTLLLMWRTLEELGGEGWWVTRPYDNQLIGMEATDRSRVLAVNVVAELYGHGRHFVELGALMQKVLEQCDDQGRGCTEVKMAALFFLTISLDYQGRFHEGNDVSRRLGELVGSSMPLEVPDEGAGILQMSSTFNTYGVCAQTAGRHKDAEGWFRKVLKAQEGGGLSGSFQKSLALFNIGRCVREDGRPWEAEELFQRALKIDEAKLGPDDVEVAYTLHEMGLCARDGGRSEEAEELFLRALKIKEAKLGADDVQVAYTLHGMGVCVRDANRLGEAEGMFQRALKIKEAKLGPGDVDVAYTLHEMGVCVRDANRLGEAERLFRRALKIKEVKLGPDDYKVAVTLHEMGLCVRDAGRLGEAEGLFRRALKILETKLGPDDIQVAYTLYGMGPGVREEGRLEEAEGLFRRALKILETKLGSDDIKVAYTLYEMGVCARDAERVEEAIALFQRGFKIQEAAQSIEAKALSASTPECF